MYPTVPWNVMYHNCASVKALFYLISKINCDTLPFVRAFLEHIEEWPDQLSVSTLPLAVGVQCYSMLQIFTCQRLMSAEILVVDIVMED